VYKTRPAACSEPYKFENIHYYSQAKHKYSQTRKTDHSETECSPRPVTMTWQLGETK